MRRPSSPLVASLLMAALLCTAAQLPAPVRAQEAPPGAEAPDDQPLPDGVQMPGDKPLIDEPDADDQSPPVGSTTTSPSSSTAPPVWAAGMMGVFMVFYFMFIAAMILIGVGGLIVSCLAIYDCARRDFPDPNTRAMWCLLIALTRLLGAVIYYFVIYRAGDPPIQRATVPGVPPPSPMSG